MTESEVVQRFKRGRKVASPDDNPYSAVAFAEKHGLTLRAAEVVLWSNGPSRAKCDAAAVAFLAADRARLHRKR